MAYLDDWSGVNPDDQQRLQQICEACSHMRYMHGSTNEIKAYGFRSVTYMPGKCVNCTCTEFCADPPITKDDVLDVVERLKGDVHISDLGISQISCTAIITRWAGSGSIVLSCHLTGGHTGEHEV